MEKSFLHKFGVLILLAAMGAVSFFLLFPHISPKASLNLEYNRAQILQKANEYMAGRGFNIGKLHQDSWFEFDGNTQLALRLKYGIDSANALLARNTLPAHAWYISWYDASVPRSQALESFDLWMTPSGRVMGLKHDIKDSAMSASLTEEQARSIAEGFLRLQSIDIGKYRLKSSSQTKQQNRLDHNFNWVTIDTAVQRGLWIRVQGNELGGYKEWVEHDAAFERVSSKTQTSATLIGTVSFAVVFLLFFFIVIFFLKKYHEGEVGTRTAVLVFAGLFLVYFLGSLNQFNSTGASTQIGDMNKLNVRWVMFGMMVLIIQVFLSVMVFSAWSVGESYSRSFWPNKLTAVDSTLFRRFFTRDVAEGILRGFTLGLIILGGFTLLVFLGGRYASIRVYVMSASGISDGLLPAGNAILNGLEAAIFGEIVFRLFFLSMFRDKTNRNWIGVLVSSALWALAMFPLWPIPFGFFQLPITVSVFFGFGLVFSFLFLRYDLLTTIIAHFVLISLTCAIPLFTSSGSYFSFQAILFFVFLSVPLLVAAVGFVRNEQFEFSHELIPSHIRRISERERMSKELEIARRVQLSLLPKASPSASGYDIAGTCIPALEVGGDYYDFVNLGGKKIGIAIGDVSGKGVPAAIYMTLTKGILQSHAEENVSPKKVLSKVNSLMYRTIDRNSFVSMFYAILDVEAKKIRFARAGQCPVIVAQRQNEKGSFLTPKGMALGLEVGTIFDSVLEEREMDLNSGEVLVFYTDGFTEAMNEHEQEFGEERLVESIDRHREKAAAEIINAICADVASFTKDWQQHDDMTMVVVKVG